MIDGRSCSHIACQDTPTEPSLGRCPPEPQSPTQFACLKSTRRCSLIRARACTWRRGQLLIASVLCAHSPTRVEVNHHRAWCCVPVCVPIHEVLSRSYPGFAFPNHLYTDAHTGSELEHTDSPNTVAFTDVRSPSLFSIHTGNLVDDQPGILLV